ncbi:hypothetical protein LEP1GSC059_2848 [Leptospira noguchii serovar Panama str. CZ214]|uniref:Uncharacterized protein n=1 Tax=Leptospira noguchii serovar Panama str. CZ214 TaxID=1001595 RepID=T0GR93_9LEPT|nr:hypothetical protein LEP1GSC059_2848 [Leptospira noguchii serovar Panama str. CZ214]
MYIFNNSILKHQSRVSIILQIAAVPHFKNFRIKIIKLYIFM